MKAIQFVIALGALWPGVAYSQVSLPAFVDGNFLFRVCDAGGEFCAGYITGIADGVQLTEMGRSLVCIPASANMKQVVDIVLNDLRAHPEKRRYSAATIVGAALKESFPCQPEPK
jgi:hypothetical protein